MIQDEELRNLYKISSEERLQILQEGLQYLQTHPDDEATWAQLRREVHSLKGDSRSVGIDSVETLARGVGEILLSLSRQKIAFTSQVSDRIFHPITIYSDSHSSKVQIDPSPSRSPTLSAQFTLINICGIN